MEVVMNRIKQLREEFQFSQNDLAQRLGGAPSSIAMYEKEERKPSMEVLIKLSEIFNCSIDYILGKTDIRNIDELKQVEFANAGGLDTKGLDDDDLKELQRQIDYIKKMKEKNERKK